MSVSQYLAILWLLFSPPLWLNPRKGLRRAQRRIHRPFPCPDRDRNVSRLHIANMPSSLEPIREVLESDESDVIPCWALDSLESARCGSPNSALSRTAVAYVTRAI